jgi:hypothetical protein
MFVGVGFDWGALSAKLGISGDVSLGVVSLPIYAAAGLRVTPEVDKRSLSTDIRDMLASSDMIYPPGPPKQFRFDAFYKFGVRADIEDILSGSISAKLRIKFFWFSKTWQKQIAKFESPFDPIHLNLINVGGDAAFSDHGLLGFLRMPTAFVNFAELEEPPALPPLPDPNTGGTGGTGTGGTAGTAGTAGNGGSGNHPPVSLLVAGDPRYKDFDAGRVEELFYNGYCECSTDAACQNDLDCCADTFCIYNDRNNTSSCGGCVEEADPIAGGELCENSGECCGLEGGGDAVCRPKSPFANNDQSYCLPCVGHDEYVSDDDEDGYADHNECCPGLQVYRGPWDSSPGTGDPVCSGCRQAGDSCNDSGECCPSGSNDYTLVCDETFECVQQSVVK